MADIQRRKKADGEVRWDVRYRDEARKQRKRSFARKVDAQQFANSVETDLSRREWIDPKRGQELFETWAEKWLATTADRKPKTRESYESILSKHFCHVSEPCRSRRSTTRWCSRSLPNFSRQVPLRRRFGTFAMC